MHVCMCMCVYIHLLVSCWFMFRFPLARLFCCISCCCCYYCGCLFVSLFVFCRIFSQFYAPLRGNSSDSARKSILERFASHQPTLSTRPTLATLPQFNRFFCSFSRSTLVSRKVWNLCIHISAFPFAASKTLRWRRRLPLATYTIQRRPVPRLLIALQSFAVVGFY